ncbi:MAG: HEAT repeat domain-containing protein, partial [Prochlorotrichaceae cyanobacterium]
TQIQQLTNQLEATPQLETLKAQYEARIQDLTQQLAAAQAPPAAAATATPTITTPTATTDSTPAIEPEVVTPPEPILATESTESTAIPEPLPTKTIAPRSTGITLEELTTLPYLSEDTTRIRLAESLLEALQAQSRPEISQTFLLTTLKRLSEDPLPRLRELAVLCLAQLQSSKAVPILRPRLWDTDAAVVQAANQALEFWRSHGKRKQPTRKPKTHKASRQA